MAKIYLTTNTNRQEPSELLDAGHVHVKAKPDGSQTIVITEADIQSPSLVEKTFDQAQDILNDWVDSENQSPELDIDGQPIYQPFINLGAYFA